MAHLHIVDPEGSERDFALVEHEYVIGRDPDVSLPLSGSSASTKVSRRHARLFRRGAQWLVEDLESSNGVFLNGARITEARILLPDSDLEIGGFLFKLMEGEAVQAGLKGLSAPVLNVEFTMSVGEHDVGRADAPITIADPSVSRRHATITVEAARILVRDHQSSNGTFKNGTRVSFTEAKHGDTLRFGSIDLLVSLAAIQREPLPIVRSLGAIKLPRRTLVLAGLAAVTLTSLLATVVLVGLRKKPPVHSAAQQAYENAILSDMVRAHTFAQQSAWPQAQQAFMDVLNKDPINREARAGLAAATAQVHLHKPQQNLQQKPTPTVAAAIETLSSRYTNEEVRQAVLRYAAGDIASAEQALRLLAKDTAGALSERLEAVKESRASALRAEEKQQWDKAKDAWQKALEVDGAIVPLTYPSALRDEAQAKLNALKSRTK